MKTATRCGDRAESIEGVERRLATYRERDATRPGLWACEIRECEIVLARLRAGLELTRLQRGLPSVG